MEEAAQRKVDALRAVECPECGAELPFRKAG
jgi:hypothetical protein